MARSLGFGLLLVAACSTTEPTGPPSASPDPSEGGSGGAGGEAPTPVGATFTEVSHEIVYEPTGHVAFPDLARTEDGIVLVYREGASHVDDSGRIVLQRAGLDGTGWTAPVVAIDTPDVDDRDPSLVRLSSGALRIDWFRYQVANLPDGNLILHQIFSAESSDGGVSWSPPTQVSEGPIDVPAGASIDGSDRWVTGEGDPITVWACSSEAVEIDGELVLPAYGGHTLNLADLAGSPRSTLTLLRGNGPLAPQPLVAEGGADLWLQEPSLVVHDGTWLVHARTAEGTSPSNPGPMVQSRSTDGTTWSPWERFDFVGHAPHLYALGSGVLLSAFREIDDAYTEEWVSFVHSVDGGASWSAPQRIADCGAAECGYPSLLELPDGRLLIVYYGPGGSSIEARTFQVDLTFAPD